MSSGRKNKVKNIPALLLIAFLLTAFIVGVTYADQPRYGGTLIFGTMAQPLNLDPGVITDNESRQVAAQIFETLVRYDSINKRFIPLLATGWQPSADRKIWTFTLRKNVKFHDGTPFNAQAVKFSWERQIQTNHKFHSPGYGNFVFYRGVWGGYPGNIRKIDVLNDHTLQVTLQSRCDGFLRIISHLPFAVVSPQAVTSKGKNFTMSPVGTGPFMFREWRDWMRIDLVANKNYWGGRPYLDHVVFSPFPGETTRYRLARRGWVDILENPIGKLEQEITAGQHAHLRLARQPGTNFSYISLNCSNPPLNNPLVRRALNFAVNKPYIMRQLKENYKSAQSPIINYSGGEDVAGKAYPANISIARSLLNKAGYANGFTLELWYVLNSRPYMQSPERIAQHVAEQWKQAGVNVVLKGVRWEKYQEKLRFGQYQAALTGFQGIDYDPDLYFQLAWGRNNAVLGGTNNTFYQSEKVCSHLENIRTIRESAAIAKSIREVQEILANDCPIIPLFHRSTPLVINTRVKGLSVDRDGIIYFSRVWVEK